MRAIHQCVPGLNVGDAVTTQVLVLQKILHDMNIPSEIFAAVGPEKLAGQWRPYEQYAGDPDNVTLYHYCVGSPLTAWAHTLPDRVIVCYHNITPAGFMDAYNPDAAQVMRQGRADLATFAHLPYALADSDYNSRELESFGFARVDLLPLILNFDQIHNSANSPTGQAIVERYCDGWANWLTVSRIAPNKCQDDVIRLFAYYQRWINPCARLFIVGPADHQEAYLHYLQRFVARLNVPNVHFTGRVPFDAGFGGYFAAASVFVSMSEHEGFGMTPLEAMAFDIPVMAFAAAAIPDTLGQAGVLFTEKKYEVLAELADMLIQPGPLRHQIIAGQRRHVAQFMPQVTIPQAQKIFQHLLEME